MLYLPQPDRSRYIFYRNPNYQNCDYTIEGMMKKIEAIVEMDMETFSKLYPPNGLDDLMRGTLA